MASCRRPGQASVSASASASALLLAAASLTQDSAVLAKPMGFFGNGPYSSAKGHQIDGEDEVVHFYAVGDWGAQPYQPIFNGGSMHNNCEHHPDTERCTFESEVWYREENAQKNVMEQMRVLAKSKPIKWVVNVGDNFYFEGIPQAEGWEAYVRTDRFKATFENMYKDEVFHVPWLSVLGNHDYGGDCCSLDLFGGCKSPRPFGGKTLAVAQIDYDTDKDWQWPQEKKHRWVMPDFQWEKTMDLGPYKVHIVGIDTNIADASKACFKDGGCKNEGTHEAVASMCPPGAESNAAGGQCVCFFTRIFTKGLDFLEQSMEKAMQDPKVAWRFVVAHHPWNFIPRTPGMMDRFLNLLQKYKVQVLFTGHVHSMRHDILQNGVNMVMTGSSGGYQYDAGDAPAGDPIGSTVWSSGFLDYGFASISMTKKEMEITYINDQGKSLKTVKVEANPSFVYETQAWTTCSDRCGQGKMTRALQCKRVHKDEHEARPLEDCLEEAKGTTPSTEVECFADEEPPLQFCQQCGSGDSCSQCAEGFVVGSEGACVNDGAVATLQVAIASPPADGWRAELKGMLEALLQNVTDLKVLATPYSAVRKQAPQDLASIQNMEAWTVRRRLGEEAYHVTATVKALDPKVTAEELYNAIESVPSSPMLPILDLSAVGTSVLAVESFTVFCPGLVPVQEGKCPEDHASKQASVVTKSNVDQDVLAAVPVAAPAVSSTSNSMELSAWAWIATACVAAGLLSIGCLSCRKRDARVLSAAASPAVTELPEIQK